MKRCPFVAAVLSAILPGSGQIYGGRKWRGIAIFSSLIISILVVSKFILLLVEHGRIQEASELLYNFIMAVLCFNTLMAFDAYAVTRGIRILPSLLKAREMLKLFRQSGITLFANNFYALDLQDAVYKPLRLVVVAVLALFVPVQVGLAFYLIFSLYALLQLASLSYEKHRSHKMGLRFFVIRKGPPFILTPLLRKHGAPAGEKYLELHVRIRKYPDLDTYNRAMEQDAQLLRRLVDEGKLSGTLVFNSFNRRASGVLEKAFTGYPMFKKEGICLARVNLTGWEGRRFQKMQKKMFGKVLSNRDVGKPQEWDLLIINPA